MSEPLAGQVAIISGGLGDIGRAIALELARRGADVAVGDILNAERAEPVLAELTKLGRRARYDRVDVADAQAVADWVRSVEQGLGLATLIVPNAAVVHLAGLEELTAEQWRRELGVNLDGAFHLAQATAKRLLDRGSEGRIVFIGSWAGHAAQLHVPAYCVSKAGLRMLCRCMAAGLAPRGILVNEVAPGYVDAGLSGRVFKEDPAVRERFRATVPVGRLIEPAEVAVQVAQLCDPASRHIVGTTVVMDGGLSLLGPGTTREG